MVPADQSLERADAVLLEIEQRLVVKLELVALDRHAILANGLQDDEFVAAQASDELTARRLLNAPAGFDEQDVSGGVAERVVDHLELVEVEAMQRKQAAAAFRSA